VYYVNYSHITFFFVTFLLFMCMYIQRSGFKLVVSILLGFIEILFVLLYVDVSVRNEISILLGFIVM
jgi:hypothetical protein